MKPDGRISVKAYLPAPARWGAAAMAGGRPCFWSGGAAAPPFDGG